MRKRKSAKRGIAKKAANRVTPNAAEPESKHSNVARDIGIILGLPGAIEATLGSTTLDVIGQLLADVARALGMGFVVQGHAISINEQPDAEMQRRLALLPYVLFLIGEQAQPYADELQRRWTSNEDELTRKLVGVELDALDPQYSGQIGTIFSDWSLQSALVDTDSVPARRYRL